MRRVVLCLALAVGALIVNCGGGGGSSASSQPAPKPSVSGISPIYGMAGSSVTITGTNLGGVTAVKFNSTAASFTQVSDTQVKATVPSGATSGSITVTTSSGSTQSSQSFLVSHTANTRELWVNDLDAAGTWKKEVFERAYQNTRCNVWIRLADASTISQSLLEGYGDYFAKASWPDVTTYVYTPTEFFGEAGNRVNILFYNAKKGVAGYFWGKDFYTQAAIDTAGYGDRLKSNEGNFFYINIDSAVDTSNQAEATLFTEGTLTHEFQHMCNAHYFSFDAVGSAKSREMDSWANEFCSVTMESVFAGQADVYIPSYQRDSSFATGASDFIQWRNDFTQYTGVSLLGTYILSQMPEASRPHFIKNFLANTCIEGSSSSQVLTSVEDLQATLQDSKYGWTPGKWTTVSNFSTDSANIRDNWSLLMRSFAFGLTGQNTSYNTYIAAISSQTISPVCLGTAGGTFNLKPSGFVIGKTTVTNLDSVVFTDASALGGVGSHSAYVIVFNGTLPSGDVLNDDQIAVENAPLVVTTSQLLARATAESATLLDTWKPWKYNRAMNAPKSSLRGVPQSSQAPALMTSSSYRPTILGAGDKANGGSSRAGYNYCFFLERTK